MLSDIENKRKIKPKLFSNKICANYLQMFTGKNVHH